MLVDEAVDVAREHRVPIVWAAPRDAVDARARRVARREELLVRIERIGPAGHALKAAAEAKAAEQRLQRRRRRRRLAQVVKRELGGGRRAVEARGASLYRGVGVERGADGARGGEGAVAVVVRGAVGVRNVLHELARGRVGERTVPRRAWRRVERVVEEARGVVEAVVGERNYLAVAAEASGVQGGVGGGGWVAAVGRIVRHR